MWIMSTSVDRCTAVACRLPFSDGLRYNIDRTVLTLHAPAEPNGPPSPSHHATLLLPLSLPQPVLQQHVKVLSVPIISMNVGRCMEAVCTLSSLFLPT